MFDFAECLGVVEFAEAFEGDQRHRVGRARSIVWAAKLEMFCTICIGIVRCNERDGIHRA